MNKRNQQEAEARKVYELYWESYTKGNLEAFSSTLDDAFEMIGTSASEVCHSKDDGIAFYKAQMHEVVGKAEMRNRRISVKPVNGMFLFNEICDIYILNEHEWNFYSSIRISTFLHETSSGWKVIQQHGSLPDLRVQDGETIAFEKISKENLELKDAIKRNTIELQNKNRELEIETALERVRALTLAMHNSEDVGKCIIKMFSELTALGVDEGTRFGIGILNHDNENNQLWTARKDGEEVNMHIGNLDMTWHPLLKSARKAWKNRLPLHKYVLDGEDLLNYYQMINNAPDYKLRVAIENLPEREFHYGFVFEHGFFYAFSPREFQPELIHIAQRFSALFEQTYQRYLDLVKAEAQAREAEIELALERVRARSMGMQKSEELKEVIQVVYDQMVQLNILVEHAGFIMDYKERDVMLIWLADEHAIPFQVTLPYFDCAHWNSFKQAKENGKDFFANLLGFDEKNKFYKDLFAFVPGVQEESLAYYFQCPGLAISTVLLDNVGLYIENFDGIPFTDDENRTLMRFGKVFQQTYTRFLDLQKAEAQAREAQIEAALEKVRSRSLAMHWADELGEVVTVVVEKLRELHIPVDDGVALVTFVEGSKDLIEWMENPGFPAAIKFYQPYFDHPVLSDFWKAKNEGLDFVAPKYNAEENRSFLEHIFEYGDYKNTLQEVKDYCLAANTYSYSVAFQKNSSIFINDYSGRSLSDAEIEILKRFSKVFEQAYIRFLDLQKAEAQAREAHIEAALERVRSRSMAMHHSDELLEAGEIIFVEMQKLGIESLTAGFVLMDKEGKNGLNYTPHPGTKKIMPVPVIIPHNETIHLQQVVENWKNGHPFFIIEMDEVETIKHQTFIAERSTHFPLTAAELIAISPARLVLHNFYFREGYVLIVGGEKLSVEQTEIMLRFAKVFQQTYTRFLDLQKAEAQAKEAQIELSLERIRAQVTAMQESSDLLDIVVAMRIEFVKLGHEAHYFWHMRWLPERYDKAMTSGDGTKIGMVMTLPRHIHGDIPLVADWEKTKEPTVVLAMDVETAVDYVEKMITLGDFEQVDPQAPTLDDIRHIGGLTFVMARTTHGEIGYSLPGVVTDPPKNAVDTLVRFAGVFDLAYKRFEDLKAAERQHREAQIELALERVRARTMAMQHSDELADASQVLDQQVRALGIETWGSAFHIYADNADGDYEWFSSANGNLPFYKTPREKFFLTFYEKGQQGEKFYVEEFKGEDCKAHYDFLKTIPVMGDALMDLEASGVLLPSYQIDHIAFFQHGYILFITYKPVTEAYDVFQRFAKVFEQTFTRFLDLQKAEAQAREAKIETALEKVRSRTMGMQSSDELPEVANLLFTEVRALGIHAWSCGYNILAEDKKTATCCMSSEGTLQTPFQLRLWGEASFDEMGDFVRSEKNMLVQELGGKALAAHYAHMKSFPDLKPTFDEIDRLGLSLPTYQINHLCKFNQGFILFITYEKVPDAHDIFRRFTNVFDQTYTRFLDLKKAEEQARKARIENALEKVRSRSLAMQSPDELIEVAQLLREEMGALGVEELETSSIYIHDENTGTTQCWFTIKNTEEPDKAVTDQMTINLQDTWVGRKMMDFYCSPAKQTSILMQGAQRIEWIRYCEERTTIFSSGGFYGDTIPDRTYHLYKFSDGFIGAAAPGEISHESWELLKRATAVFSFAYTRFRDLQMAEASARAARRQASLDRVRADISSMRSTEDLNRITPLIWNELTTLGIPFIRCGIFIVDEKMETVAVHLSSPDGSSLAVMNLAFGANELTYRAVDAWKKNEVHVQHWDKTDFINYGKLMVSQGQVKDLNAYQGNTEAPESLHLHFIPFSQGLLYVGAPQLLDQEQTELLSMLAKTFAIAYARYEDFVKLEQAKTEVESAMSELKATQSQLVQQEKLASLGQLTAGIAHEIKNPLNFVNNFTEVSIELIEETLEEMLKHDDEKDESLINHNLDDIKSNLKKVYDHGTRANSIVNSMLMHSRGGGGTPQPTLLNNFIREYSNLAFHGMRAGSNPLDVQIVLDLDEKVKDVPLIVEDFSRVVLNICNNAFDAMREKRKAKYEVRGTKFEEKNTKYEDGDDGTENYLPKLSIQTRLEAGNVLIQFEDNALGIPDEIKDKILQPFFTTKKGTEGTGLGLSISNDIVKAHGGELKVDAREGQGSVFSIVLPGCIA